MLLGISLTLRNRLVRTRMPGGVRGRGLAAPFYSISGGQCKNGPLPSRCRCGIGQTSRAIRTPSTTTMTPNATPSQIRAFLLTSPCRDAGRAGGFRLAEELMGIHLLSCLLTPRYGRFIFIVNGLWTKNQTAVTRERKKAAEWRSGGLHGRPGGRVKERRTRRRCGGRGGGAADDETGLGAEAVRRNGLTER